jgi:HEAT repeat protein
MILISALAAFSALTAQSGTITLAGKVVQITYPSPLIRQVPDDVKGWDGFQGVSSTTGEWPAPFRVPGDWSVVTNRLSELGTASKDGPKWRVKVFLLTQTDSITMVQGRPVRQSRQRLDQGQIDAVLRGLARVPGYVRIATDGALDIALDVVIDSEPVIFGSGDDSQKWREDYINSRVNRGKFEAEDKVFRGPYHTVVLATAGQAAQALSTGAEADSLASYVVDEISRSAHRLYVGLQIYHPPQASNGGGAGGGEPFLAGQYPKEVWAQLRDDAGQSLEGLKTLYQFASQGPYSVGNAVAYPSRQAPISSNVTLSLATDDQRGSVLQYVERSPARVGGFALPYRNIDLSKTPYLSFWAKRGMRGSMALNTNYANTKGVFYRSKPLDIPSDGTWHQVVVDLRREGSTSVADMYLGPARDLDREQVGDLVYLFDDFQLVGEAQANQSEQQPLLEVEKRALAAKDLSAADLMKDTSDMVKLNGLLGRETPYVAADETALIELTKYPNVRIAGEAVKRLAQVGTPSAKAEVLRLVISSPYEYVKQVAAMEVGKFGDPKLAGVISRLFASKSWQSRMAGAKALTLVPGDEAAVISMTFLQEIDPQVRFTVTRSANAQNAVVLKRFLWSTVNDPSDAVRAESAWRLINSGKPKEVTEGYKAIRDDSVGVRLDLLTRFASNPGEGHREALRVALADSSPLVRAAALKAFSKQPGQVTAEEIANTFEDKFPVVQLALLDLAKAKGLALPASAIQSLRASMDARVVDRAKELAP